MNLQYSKRLLTSDTADFSLSPAVQRFLPILAITALGLVIRLVKVDSSFWYVEGFTGFLTRQSPGELLRFITQEDIHSPVYFLAVKLWSEIFHTDWGLHLFSVLTGVISIPILFSLSRKLFNRRVGLVAAAFLALSPFHLTYSIEARPYSLYMLLGVSALWFLVTALESDKRWNGWWLCYSLTATLILYTHSVGALTLIGLAVFHFALIWPMDRTRFYQWIGFNSIPVVLFLPWIPIVLSQVEMSKNLLAWIRPVGLRSFLNMMRWFIYFHPYDGAGMIVNVLWMMPHLVLLCLAMLVSDPSWRRKILALTAFAAFPIAAATVYSSLIQPILITRYLTPVLIPLLVLAAIPMIFFEKSRWHRLISLVTALALLLSFVSCLSFLKLGRRMSWRDATMEIKQNIQVGDAVLVFPQGAQYVFNFYFEDGKNTKVKALNGLGDFESLDSKFLEDHRRLWIIRHDFFAGKESLEVVDWFARNHEIITRNKSFKWLEVILIRLDHKGGSTISDRHRGSTLS